MLTLTFYSGGEEKGGKYSEKKNIFLLEEKEKEENIWSRSLQKFSRILKSLDFGLGLETFANFWRVSVSLIWSRRKSLGFGFGKFALGKKVSVSENMVSENKYLFWFWKICYRKKSLGIGAGQNFGIVIQCFPVHSPPPPFITKTREQTNKPTSSSL